MIWNVRAFAAACLGVGFSLITGVTARAQLIPLTSPTNVNSKAAAINDSNEVVGRYFTAFDGPFGYQFTIANGMTKLAQPAGFSYMEPADINASGEITGSVYNPFSQPRMLRISGGVSSAVALPASRSTARGIAINDNGMIVGQTSGGESFRHTTAGGYQIIPFPPFDLRDINNANQLAGSFLNSSLFQEGLRLEADGTSTPIGVLPTNGQFSLASSINEAGTIFGVANDTVRGQRPVRFRNSDGLQELNAIGSQSAILGSNDADYAVGRQGSDSFSFATLWKPDGSFINLNAWLATVNPDLAAVWDLREATDINNNGFIVGNGFFTLPDNAGFMELGYMLDVSSIVPEPSMMGIAILAMAGTLFSRRR